MSETIAAPKPKKSVALSGVAAGNTALCTVGRTGNDLHYRGYDILDVAEAAEFEEIEIRIRLSKYNRKFATLSHEIHSRSHGLLGSGSQIVLFVDRETYRPIDIPPNVLRGFMPYAVAPTGKVPAFVTEGAAKAA